jgi:hypothetical protein
MIGLAAGTRIWIVAGVGKAVCSQAKQPSKFTGFLHDNNSWFTRDNPSFGWSQLRCRRNEKK